MELCSWFISFHVKAVILNYVSYFMQTKQKMRKYVFYAMTPNTMTRMMRNINYAHIVPHARKYKCHILYPKKINILLNNFNGNISSAFYLFYYDPTLFLYSLPHIIVSPRDLSAKCKKE